MPIADQRTHLGVEISKECSWDAHKAKVIGKGKAHVGKMDAILTDSHLDTRIKRCTRYYVECDCTKARIRRSSMGREREVGKTAGNSSDDRS